MWSLLCGKSHIIWLHLRIFWNHWSFLIPFYECFNICKPCRFYNMLANLLTSPLIAHVLVRQIFTESTLFGRQYFYVLWLLLFSLTLELQHARLSCPSLSPGVCSDSCIESVMLSNHRILCCPPLLFPIIFPWIRVFSHESVPHIRWPKYWNFSFSISPSNEYSGLIFSWGWLVWSPCSPRDCQESLPAPQFKSINSSSLSLFYGWTHICTWLLEKP